MRVGVVYFFNQIQMQKLPLSDLRKQIAKSHVVKRVTTRFFWLTYKILEIRQNIFSPKLIKKLRNCTGQFRQIPEVSKMQLKSLVNLSACIL